MRSWPISLLLGIALLALGATPLLAIIIAAALGPTSDPNPNPIGPGLLFFVTFWSAVGLIAFGALRLWEQEVAGAGDRQVDLLIPRMPARRRSRP